MSTNSSIAVLHADGTVSRIYAHWDGYLSWNGKLLLTHYNTQEKAEALVALGDISSLAASCECPLGHTFDTPVKGYTTFYGRDRGEEETEPERFASAQQYVVSRGEFEYEYLFQNGVWCVHCNGTNGKFIPVEVALHQEELDKADD